MHIYSVFGAVSSVVVAGGVATGLGFALKPSSNSVTALDIIAPPNH